LTVLPILPFPPILPFQILRRLLLILRLRGRHGWNDKSGGGE
jgi:hypothetical protein